MKYNKEQQIEIAKYAINNNYGYKETGTKYDISYQQVAAWVRKYESSKTVAKKPARVSEDSSKASTLDILSRRDPVLEQQLEDVKRRLGLID
ncbi:helix-turn-helix domain-containing protein [Companilactobacillus baiquanensis]|uniref:Helix-turn-helix domain-containing protein n=1 Tax=Companilactobacillus baiquanensis TaxID=2486005 RepID=A0ABW1UUI6_9LACO|nr:helix-turn-helix domain-containing protein [Companilactobacillus baiquanensis]